MSIEVYLGHKRPDTLTLAIRKQYFMFMVDVDIGIRPTTIPPITNLNLVYCYVFQDLLLVVMGELYIGTRPSIIPNK